MPSRDRYCQRFPSDQTDSFHRRIAVHDRRSASQRSRRCARTSGSIRPGTIRSSRFSMPAQSASAASSPAGVASPWWPQRGQPLPHLGADLAVQRRAGRPGRACRSRGCAGRAGAPARHRVGVVVDPQVDHDVAGAAVPLPLRHHQQRRALPAAPVAAGPVARAQRGEQPAGQAAARRRWPARPPRIAGDHLGAGEDVALDRVPVAGHAAGPGVAVGAGVGRAVAGRRRPRRAGGCPGRRRRRSGPRPRRPRRTPVRSSARPCGR